MHDGLVKMGKSPGKWIKAVLLGKKASKSNLSKGKEISKSSTEKASLVSNNGSSNNLDVVPSSISELVPATIAEGRSNTESAEGDIARLPSIGSILSSPKQDGDAQTTGLDMPEDSQRIRVEQAATRAQAAFRGYLACRAFQKLEGIIRLQAVIRGHLVRRQAVATLYCVQGIVKFQAIFRGQIVRCADVGIKVRSKFTLEEKYAKQLESGESNMHYRAEKLLKNAFVAKLLALSPTGMPVHLQYGPDEPNSAWDWLIRWTASRIWEPQSKPKKAVLTTKHQRVETGQARAKRGGGRLHPANVENGTNQNTSESERQKRNQRRNSNHSVNSVQANPQNEIEKVKRNLKKVSASTKDASTEREVYTDKQSQNHGRQPNLLASELSEHNTDTQSDKVRVDLEEDVSKPTSDRQTCADIMNPVNESSKFEHPIFNSDEQSKIESEDNQDILTVDKDFKDDLTGDENHNISKRRAALTPKHDNQDAGLLNVINTNEGDTGNLNQKLSKRRASLPAKHDEQDTSLPSETKVPSYMATTESAKAKVRGQVSPRFGQDAFEKNGLSRRYSLPSSTNAKLTSSPRVQSLVQASGRGGIKIDRSLSSSRDGKLIQAEWRR